MVTIKKGDLLVDATEKVIAHQVNCFGIAGGLAADIFEKWPDAGNDYKQLCGRIQSLGMFSGMYLGMPQLTGQQKDGHIIANLYGQLNPGRDYRPEALRKALTCLGQLARQAGWSVALPWKISCGICGGDWEEVLGIIEEAMEGVDCAIYRREGDE